MRYPGEFKLSIDQASTLCSFGVSVAFKIRRHYLIVRTVGMWLGYRCLVSDGERHSLSSTLSRSQWMT
jgi:hypothetical protein